MDNPQVPGSSSLPEQTASNQSSTPLFIFYGAICFAIIGIGNGIAWLAVIAVLVGIAFYIPLGLGALGQWSRFHQMKRHPERYEARITEDAEGNPVGVNWKQIR